MVEKLQKSLHTKAKSEASYRFYSLWDKIHREDIVIEAYLRVKANKGAAGIDDEMIEAFESKLKDNLYRIWNRISSGSYFLPAVKAVEIPKADGKTRLLGIPTVGFGSRKPW